MSRATSKLGLCRTDAGRVHGTPETIRRQEVIDGVIVMPCTDVRSSMGLGELFPALFDSVSARALGAVPSPPSTS